MSSFAICALTRGLLQLLVDCVRSMRARELAEVAPPTQHHMHPPTSASSRVGSARGPRVRELLAMPCLLSYVGLEWVFVNCQTAWYAGFCRVPVIRLQTVFTLWFAIPVLCLAYHFSAPS